MLSEYNYKSFYIYFKNSIKFFLLKLSKYKFLLKSTIILFFIKYYEYVDYNGLYIK